MEAMPGREEHACTLRRHNRRTARALSAAAEPHPKHDDDNDGCGTGEVEHVPAVPVRAAAGAVAHHEPVGDVGAPRCQRVHGNTVIDVVNLQREHRAQRVIARQPGEQRRRLTQEVVSLHRSIITDTLGTT